MLVDDIVYYAPEVGTYLSGETRMPPSRLTLKADIFSLGLICSLFMTGELPQFDAEKYAYPYAAVNNGHALKLESDKVPEEYAELIAKMLSLDPAERPDIQAVFHKLKREDLSGPHGLTLLKSPPRTKKHATSRAPTRKRMRKRRTPTRVRREKPTSPPASGTLKGSLIRDKRSGKSASREDDSKLRGTLVDREEE